MNEVLGMQAPKAIEKKLRRAWNGERWFCHLRGAGRLALCLVALFLFDLLVDWFFDLPGPARFLLLLANVAVIGWLAYRHWLQYLRRFDATRVSLQVEKLYPDLNNLLVSYVQLDGRAGTSSSVSSQMIEAMRGQATKATAPLDFSGIVSFRKLRTLAIVSSVVLLLFLASSAIAGEYYAILLGRLFNPFTSLSYPTRTKIEEINGPVAVKQGDKVQIDAVVGGVIPDEGYFFMRVGNAGWEESLLGPQDGKSETRAIFAHQIPKARQSFDYYFRIGDARSQTKKVKVVPPPRIVSAKVNLVYPQYTGRTAEAVAGLQLPTLPEGTAITWEIRCDQPLQAGEMRVLGEEQRSLELQIDAADAHVARLSLSDVASLSPPAQVDASPARVVYHFQWTEREHGFSFIDGTRYTLELIPDRPPVVTLLKPRSGSEQNKVVATARKNLHLIFEASDDYGLGEARIIYRVNAGPEAAPLRLGAFPSGTRTGIFENSSETKKGWLISETLPDLKEGDVLTCAVEVLDNRVSSAGPNRGRSASFQLHIVSEKEYQQHVEKLIAQGLERTTDAAREALIGSKKVQSLITEK